MESRSVREDKPRDLGLLIRRIIVGGLPALVLVLAVVLFVRMGALKPKPEEKEDSIKAAPVLVAEAIAETVRLTVETQGEVTPRTEISLVPEVSGKIIYTSPAFSEGGAFQKGEVLLRIDPAEYELRVVQARSNVAQARTRLRSEEAEADIARKEAGELGLAGSSSPLALREPQLAEARAMINSAEAALAEAELHLSRTMLRAPFDGRVRSKNADLGQYVAPGTDLGKVFSVQVMEVPLPLTDTELGQLGLKIGFSETEENPGPSVQLTTFVAGQPHEWQGRIVRTESGYDAATRVLFAYAAVEDPYGEGADRGTPLASGLFVTAKVEGRVIDGSIVVPRTALRGENTVYVATPENEIEVREVVVASTNRERAVLTAGLEIGEKVITSPVRGAADGMKIETVDPAMEIAEDTAASTQASVN